MNKLFLIVYDLRNLGRDYNSLYEAIKALSSDYQHPLESTWFVSTKDVISAKTIYEKLRGSIDENDSLFIINMADLKDRQGWMPKSFWTWFAEKVNTL